MGVKGGKGVGRGEHREGEQARRKQRGGGAMGKQGGGGFKEEGEGEQGG